MSKLYVVMYRINTNDWKLLGSRLYTTIKEANKRIQKEKQYDKTDGAFTGWEYEIMEIKRRKK